MPLSAPPKKPQVTDPSTFPQRAQAWVVWQSDVLYTFLVDSSELLGQSTNATSATSNSVTTGSKTFTVETGKGFIAGQTISIARTSDPSNRMLAIVTSYDSGTGALVADSQFIDGSGTFSDWSVSLAYPKETATYPPEVRQAINSAPIDSNGYTDLGGATGSTTLTATGSIQCSAANGSINRDGESTGLSWTSLLTNGTMYLYVDVNEDGTLTTGSSTLKPVYRWGGADDTTNGQFTFNIQEMQGKVGDGSAANQVYRVYVGEVEVSSNVVSAITWYALKGRYDSPLVNTLPSAGLTEVNHNIGVGDDLDVTFIRECITDDIGFSVGDRITGLPSDFSNTNFINATLGATYKTAYLIMGSSTYYQTTKTGSPGSITLSRWAYKFSVRRNW